MAFICLFLLVCASSYFYTTIRDLNERLDLLEDRISSLTDRLRMFTEPKNQIIERLLGKDGFIYETTAPNVDLRHKGMSQDELDKYVPPAPKFKQPSGEKRY